MGKDNKPYTTIEEMEKYIIAKALDKAFYSKKKAAKLLGITSATLHNKLSQWK